MRAVHAAAAAAVLWTLNPALHGALMLVDFYLLDENLVTKFMKIIFTTSISAQVRRGLTCSAKKIVLRHCIVLLFSLPLNVCYVLSLSAKKSSQILL